MSREFVSFIYFGGGLLGGFIRLGVRGVGNLDYLFLFLELAVFLERFYIFVLYFVFLISGLVEV